MSTNIGEPTKPIYVVIGVIVAIVLLGGTVLTVISDNNTESIKQEEQGCAYYAKRTVDEVPVACYDFFERNNHWSES